MASFPSSTLNREFSKFESLDIWKQLKNNGNNKNNNSIRSNHNVLPWYLAVSINRMPAKYLISKSIPCNTTDLRLASEEELWEKHRNLTVNGKESDQQTLIYYQIYLCRKKYLAYGSECRACQKDVDAL